jgi:hypothetical protein
MKVLQICPWLGESPLDAASGVSNVAYYIGNETGKTWTRRDTVRECKKQYEKE